MATSSSIDTTLAALKGLKEQETATVARLAEYRLAMEQQRAMLDDIRLRKRSLIASLNVLLAADSNEHIVE